MKRNCANKVKHTCGSIQYSQCVAFEGSPNETSPLAEESCLDQEIVTQDIYDQLGKIIEDTSTEGLGDKCLTYPSEPVVNDILVVFEEEICNIKDEITTLKTSEFCDRSITECGLDLNCLTTPCGDEITTLGELQQVLINEVCNLSSVPQVSQDNFVRQLVISENNLPSNYTELDICNYIMNLPEGERFIEETDSKWNVVIVAASS